MQKKISAKTIFLAAFLGLCSFAFAQERNLNLGDSPDPLPGQDTARWDGYVVMFDVTTQNGELGRYWFMGRGHGGLGHWWVAPDPDWNKGGKFLTFKETDNFLWIDQSSSGIGGVLQTHRRYADVEVIVHCKPGYGNDGGVFLRTNNDSKSWQVVIDYHDNGRMGQLYDEGARYSGGDSRTQTYWIEDNGTGCRPDDQVNGVAWGEFWDWEGYNVHWQRVRGRPIHIEATVNEVETLNWEADGIGTRLDNDGKGYVGIQIHRGADGEWDGGPNLHSFVAVRELDENTGNPMHPAIKTSPTDQTVEAGSDAVFVFELEDFANTNLTHQWQKDGENIDGATEAIYRITGVQESASGSYTVLLKDNDNQRWTRSKAGILTVTPAVGINGTLSGSTGSLQVKWLSPRNLTVSGTLDSPQTVVISNTQGEIIQRVKTEEGNFTETFFLPENGVYFISMEHNISFTPVKVFNISN